MHRGFLFSLTKDQSMAFAEGIALEVTMLNVISQIQNKHHLFYMQSDIVCVYVCVLHCVEGEQCGRRNWWSSCRGREHEVSMRIKRKMNVTCFLEYVGQKIYK